LQSPEISFEFSFEFASTQSQTTTTTEGVSVSATDTVDVAPHSTLTLNLITQKHCGLVVLIYWPRNSTISLASIPKNCFHTKPHQEKTE